MNDSETNDKVLRDIDFVFEVGSLRHIQRAWRQFGGQDFANVSEHTFRVALIAMLLANKEGADVGKAVLLALVHDLGELRTGDANYLQNVYRSDAEKLAHDDLASSTSMETMLHELLGEYKNGTSLEAKIVKDADNLDCDFELRERKDSGATIAEAFASTRDVVRGKLNTPYAQEIFDSVRSRCSHEWHLNARNRLNSGDWKAGNE